MLHRLMRSLAILAIGVSFAGCWHIMPVELRGIVTVIGVDPAPAGKYLFTVAVVDPLGLPSPAGRGGPSGMPTSIVRSAVASDLDEAVHAISGRERLQWDLAHIAAVIVSEKVARAGLLPVFDYFMRSVAVTQTGWFFVARDDSAQKLILAGQNMVPYQGSAIVDTAKFTAMHLPYYSRRVYDVLNHVPVLGKEPTATGISYLGPPGGKISQYEISGTAVFRRDRMEGWLSTAAANGLVMATGHVMLQSLTLKAPDSKGIFTLDVTSASPKIEIKSTADGKPLLLLQIHAKTFVTTQAPEVSWVNPQVVDSFQSVASRQVLADVMRAVEETKALGVDPIGFGEAIRRSNPRLWRSLEGQWPEAAYPSLPVVVRVSVEIDGFGDKIGPLMPQR